MKGSIVTIAFVREPRGDLVAAIALDRNGLECFPVTKRLARTLALPLMAQVIDQSLEKGPVIS